MKVLNFVRPENGLTEDPLYYLGFEKYENEVRDCYLFMADFYGDLYSGRYDDKEKVVLTLEEPNFCVGDGLKAQLHKRADLILTICPYTAELFDNRQFVFFPTDERFIPEEVEKEIDVCYFGSFPRSVPWDSYINNIASKYKFSYGYYFGGTNPRCSHADKFSIYAKTKIAIVHGLCNINPSDASRYLSFPKGTENKAFTHLDKGMLPQIKSRMFEAAFCKSLILCQKDPWNPIEYFFEPDVDFMYFTDEDDLMKKVDHILNNYSEYDKMRQSAFDKAVNNYTTRSFVEKYLK